MNTLFVPVTAKLERLAQECGTTPYEIIERFAANLTGTAKHRDKEEQFMAQEYFLRTHAHQSETYQTLKKQLAN